MTRTLLLFLASVSLVVLPVEACKDGHVNTQPDAPATKDTQGTPAVPGPVAPGAPARADDSVRRPAGDTDDLVTRELFRQYVVGRGRISSRTRNAAIELVAVRGRNPAFIRTVLTEFEKSCESDDARTIRRNLLAVMSKMLAAEGGGRWRYEHARRTGEVEPSATTVTPKPSPENDRIVYRESEMLARVIACGYQADRFDIDAFVIAVRQAHHPQGKPFLLDVLRNPAKNPDERRDESGVSPEPSPAARGAPGAEPKWPDNRGGHWLDAKFHAAVGLAELGEHAGVEWLIAQSERNEFGVGSASAFLNHAPHRKAARSNLRESCVHVLADLSELEPTDDAAQWRAWWAANKDRFDPRPVALWIE